MVAAVSSSVVRTTAPDRWAAALDRARANGLHVRATADPGVYRVSSSSVSCVWHTTTVATCDCVGFQHTGVCQYVAAVRSAEALAAPANCHVCYGGGWVWMNPESVRCEHCDGTGREPAPRVVIVASNDDQPDPDPSGPASELAKLYRELDAYNAIIARDGRLSSADYRRFVAIQNRVADLQTRTAVV